MCVTGSDAWKSQKQLSEGSNRGQSLPEAQQGLPEAVGRGNQGRGLSFASKTTFRAPQVLTVCLLAACAYLDGHDDPFSLPEHLRGAAGQFLRAGGADPGRRPAADQTEPSAGASPRPRSGPARNPRRCRDPRRRTRPSTRTTHSERSFSAVRKAGESGSATTWVRP